MSTAGVQNIATGITYGSGGIAAFGGLTANEIAAVGGLVVATMGWLVNGYFRYKTSVHEKQLVEAARAKVNDNV